MTAVKRALNLTLHTRPTPAGLRHVYKLQFCHDNFIKKFSYHDHKVS